MKKRGVVIAGTCDMSTIDGQVTLRCPPTDPNLIRTSLLYWDRIDIPDGDTIKVGLSKELDVLIQDGILTRQPVKTATPMGFVRLTQLSPNPPKFSQDVIDNGSFSKLVQVINQGPIKAFEELAKDKNVLWSYFKSTQAESSVGTTQVPRRSFLFEIHEALPLPNPDTPLEKILDFKLKRQSELIALRNEIDAAYQRVSNASDIVHAKSMVFNELDLALKDLSKVANENLKSKMARSLKFEINPINMATAVGALAVTGSIMAGTLIALGSCFRLDFSETIMQPNLPERLTPYRYLLDANKELKMDIAPHG